MASPSPRGIAAALTAPVVFVTGKGGVGKSTIAGALAVASATAGLRAAYLELDDDEAGRRALRGSHGVTHLVVGFEEALEGAIAPIVGGSVVARTMLRAGPIARLSRAMPSLREFVSLEKIRTIVASRRYDRIVVDLPASGHAVDWLRVPQAFERFLNGGPLGALGKRIHDEVVAPGKCEVIIVTLAEPMVISETGQLAAKLQDELGRSPSHVIVNRMVPADPAGALEASEKLARAAAGEACADALHALLLARKSAAETAREALAIARGLKGVTIVPVPDAPVDPSVQEVVRWLDAGVTT